MDEKPAKRGRGRPRSFDPDQALDRAVGVFWRKGFDGASLDDLSAAMGIARPSIYSAFGDKQALFLRSLERYSATVAAGPVEAMGEADGIESALGAFLTRVVENTTCDVDHPGCLMVGVAAMVDDADVRAAAARSVAQIEEAVAERLQAAVDAGELPAGYPVARGARRAADALLSLSARARTGTPREELLEDAADGVSSVLSLAAR
jgi:AcrR family transcriptional regulator